MQVTHSCTKFIFRSVRETPQYIFITFQYKNLKSPFIKPYSYNPSSISLKINFNRFPNSSPPFFMKFYPNYWYTIILLYLYHFVNQRKERSQLWFYNQLTSLTSIHFILHTHYLFSRIIFLLQKYVIMKYPP